MDGVDLSLLSSALAPREKVGDADVRWEWDSLFAQVSSDVQTERDLADEVDDADETAGTPGA